MSNFKDFVGINICIYEPTLNDSGAIGGNTLGYDPEGAFFYTDNVGIGNVGPLTKAPVSKTLVLLNLHRNGPYGYPMWKQMRTSQNHLIRALNAKNTFTYVQEPGALLGTKQAKYGNIISLKEPTISSNLPISLIGEVAIYNEELGIFEKKPVEIKTAFNNETVFFANQQANEYFNTILQTDENYETLKDMYLDGGLDDEGSLLDSFSLLTYRQTIWPTQQFAYLNRTRSRTFYVNTFWRSARDDRSQLNVDNGFGAIVPSQSMWSLDSRLDFETRTAKTNTAVPADPFAEFKFDIGGTTADNTANSPGQLLNRYSTFTLAGFYNKTTGEPAFAQNFLTASLTLDVGSALTASAIYSRLHTLKNLFSGINPSGPFLINNEMVDDQVAGAPLWPSNSTGSIFNGHANWDAPALSGKEPFYDSYEKFSEDIKRKGKGYSIIPEFKISAHVEEYQTKGVTAKLSNIFELSGGLSQNTTTESEPNFYKILSTTDFLKHFDLVKKDHKGFADEKILTIKCKAIKKFVPYEGFYPNQRTMDISRQFSSSYGQNIDVSTSGSNVTISNYDQFSIKPLLTPICAPGILFNTIKSGIAVDFPLIFQEDIIRNTGEGFNTFMYADDIGRRLNGTTTSGAYTPSDTNNMLLGHTARTPLDQYDSIYSSRVPFEALVEPEVYLANENLVLQEPHVFGLSDFEIETNWDGGGNSLYKKMISNFLAEVPEFFISNKNFKTISSLEEQNPEFGNAISGTYYLMRVKMTKSREGTNKTLGGLGGFPVVPPQDVVSQGINTLGQNPAGGFATGRSRTVRESITMYSRPSSFGPPSIGDGGNIEINGLSFWMGSSWGFNFPYTPPYYHGESWCDLVFYADETKKYTLDEILSGSKEYPYFTRYWNPSFHDALRDLSGYRNNQDPLSATTTISGSRYEKYYDSPWADLMTNPLTRMYQSIEPISQSSANLNYNWEDWGGMVRNNVTASWKAPQTVPGGTSTQNEAAWRYTGPQSPVFLNYNAMQLDSSINLFGKGTVREVLDREVDTISEVASSDTIKGKTRWIIQSKFECPILNFNKYDDLNQPNLTRPNVGRSQVPRGMWHQYGDIPSEDEGIHLQVSDIPQFWLRGALGIARGRPQIKSLADLVGFSRDPVRLGEVASQKEISECVVAVPFIEQSATRKFFSIPRADINSCIDATRREIGGQFPAGGPPKAGDTVYQMVKKMQKYVFPPSMDFVRYEEIDPFAMYIFEFKHTLSKQDLADIWQNLSPEIGTKMEESEASISHELLSAELLGDGAVVKNNTLDENAEGKGIPSNIQWMIFKVKKRAKTNYFDKVVAKKGTTDDTSGVELVGVTNAVTGKKDKDITYNWPYDFFSLVELVKIDAEVSFANIVNDDKGQKSIKKVESKKARNPSSINKARGKG